MKLESNLALVLGVVAGLGLAGCGSSTLAVDGSGGAQGTGGANGGSNGKSGSTGAGGTTSSGGSTSNDVRRCERLRRRLWDWRGRDVGRCHGNGRKCRVWREVRHRGRAIGRRHDIRGRRGGDRRSHGHGRRCRDRWQHWNSGRGRNGWKSKYRRQHGDGRYPIDRRCHEHGRNHGQQHLHSSLYWPGHRRRSATDQGRSLYGGRSAALLQELRPREQGIQIRDLRRWSLRRTAGLFLYGRRLFLLQDSDHDECDLSDRRAASEHGLCRSRLRGLRRRDWIPRLVGCGQDWLLRLPGLGHGFEQVELCQHNSLAVSGRHRLLGIGDSGDRRGVAVGARKVEPDLSGLSTAPVTLTQLPQRIFPGRHFCQ